MAYSHREYLASCELEPSNASLPVTFASYHSDQHEYTSEQYVSSVLK